MEQKIKQTDIFIGKNIRKIRLSKGIHQHITASQLRGIRDCLNTTYDELLEPDETEKASM